MELQSFINQNDNYLDKLKEQNVYIRKYTPLNLCITKTYYNKDYDYEKYPWLKYCRGAVINIKTNRIVCIPPCKATKENNNIQEIIDNYDETKTYEALLDGTMINMFYHNDEWFLSTRSSIGGRNSWDGKKSFRELFLDVHGSGWFSELNKKQCYSFLLSHKKNRNISPINFNQIFLIESYEFTDNGFYKKENEEITNIQSNFKITKEYIQHYNGELPFSIKGLTIKTENERINWINPNFKYVKGLKMNYNDKFMNYILLRQKRLLREYLLYFPEESYLFEEYRENYHSMKNKLYNRYVSRYIKKEITNHGIEYPFKPHVIKLHHYYQQSGEKINTKIVSDYFHKLDAKEVKFIQNYLN
tara:strand:+ start:3546 stop:4622 length:1077 start_codon:yes stop_codon:yes gene_type:complete